MIKPDVKNDPVVKNPSTTPNEPTLPPLKSNETPAKPKRKPKKTAAKKSAATKREPKVGGIHPFGTCVPQGECQCPHS